jgi:hypothetical protein
MDIDDASLVEIAAIDVVTFTDSAAVPDFFVRIQCPEMK